MRLLVYNIKGNIFAKLFVHVERQSAAGPQNKSTARKQFTPQAVYCIAQRTKKK